MESSFKERQQRSYARMRRIRDISMGIIILLIGLLIFFADKLGLALNIDDSLMKYLFGGLCLLYGGFRFYRGMKNDL